MIINPHALNIYTDGSSLPTPRRGGIGVRFVFPDHIERPENIQDFEYPGYKEATNNEMELMACIKALEEGINCEDELSDIHTIVINTDSKYISDNFNRAFFQWSKNKWFKKNGDPVLNADLWKELLKLVTKLRKINKRIEINWVPGKKDDHTKRVDKLAKKSAQSPTHKPLAPRGVRRKISPIEVNPGCIEMKGQRFSIRIIAYKYLKVQKLYMYTYEVITKNSAFYQFVDYIYSDIPLKEGHHYYVKVNQDNSNPRIVKVYRELKRK